MLRLLDDESVEIQRIIRQEILKHALNIIFNRRNVIGQLPTQDLGKFEGLLKEVHLGVVMQALSQLINAPQEELDLEKGVIVLSYWDKPTISPAAISGQLDILAEDVAANMPSSGHPLTFIDHINQMLFREKGFRGNSSDYYNPANSLIHKVLKTRLGIPISLSTVYMLVARRLNFPVYGVAMPAHFILKFDNGEDEIFFDPFHGGKVYSQSTCLEYLQGFNAGKAEDILRGCSSYEIISRILRNLHIVYSSHTVVPEKVSEIESFLSLFEVNDLA